MKLIINKENPEGIEVELTAEEQATKMQLKLNNLLLKLQKRNRKLS